MRDLLIGSGIVLFLVAPFALGACDIAEEPAEPAPAPSVAADATPPPPPLTGPTLQRHQDLLKVKAALEKYAAANGGSYPVAEKFQGYISGWGPSLGANWIPELVPTYIDALPRDPANAENVDGQIYVYWSDGKDYKLLAHGYGDCSPAVELDGVKIDPVRNKDGKCWAYGVWTPNAAGH